MPESKDVPSSLVTVWGACVILVQVTFVPTLMVSVAGLKAKLPLLSVVIVTAWPLPAVVAVGVVPTVGGVGVLPEVGVEVEPVPVEEPPQAVKRTSMPSVSRTSQTLYVCAEKNEPFCAFPCIVFPFLQVLRAEMRMELASLYRTCHSTPDGTPEPWKRDTWSRGSPGKDTRPGYANKRSLHWIEKESRRMPVLLEES